MTTAGATRVRGLIAAGHPVPCLAITAIMMTLAVAMGADAGDLLVFGLGALAGELSVGWSNDFFDADSDARAGRTDKPIVGGVVSRRAVAAAAVTALAASVVLCYRLGPDTGTIHVVRMLAGWSYNVGLKSSLASGLAYAVGFGLIPAFAASAGPAGTAAPAWMWAAAALLGLGGHFANVLPDLAADRASCVRGLPQRVAAGRGGALAVRWTALVLLLAATILVTVAGGPPRSGGPGLYYAGLAVAALLGVACGFGRGRIPFYAAMGIAGLDAALLLLAA